MNPHNNTQRNGKSDPAQYDSFAQQQNDETRLEGRNPVAEALAAGRSINRVFVLASAAKSRPDAVLASLVAQCRDQGAIIQYLNRAELDRIATTRSHQGIIVEAAPHRYSDLDDILLEYEDKQATPFFLLLDQIQDAHNLGAILRIADGAGVTAVIIPKRRSVPLNAAVAKASAGAVEYVALCRVNNLTQTILSLKEKGFWIFGTSAAGGLCYDQADYSGSIALIVGSEGQGMSKKIAEHCDFLLTIPLHGKVNSLNAAVACGIVTFAAAQQRGQTDTCAKP
ncbi:MAG TPA: 23S rRNA (guanosine(2251)-2'-O)-methyltransferase RlmB [Clostridia bacterium]|nr:23S rRNA (guanosine(2251)-2'-O)-methyltransferase RlmB [Clostridia bacterium]